MMSGAEAMVLVSEQCLTEVGADTSGEGIIIIIIILNFIPQLNIDDIYFLLMFVFLNILGKWEKVDKKAWVF